LCPTMPTDLWRARGRCSVTKWRCDSKCSPWSPSMGRFWDRTEKEYALQRRCKALTTSLMTPAHFVASRDASEGAGMAPGAWDPAGGAACANAVNEARAGNCSQPARRKANGPLRISTGGQLGASGRIRAPSCPPVHLLLVCWRATWPHPLPLPGCPLAGGGGGDGRG
jgi:hypothetical protein